MKKVLMKDNVKIVLIGLLGLIIGIVIGIKTDDYIQSVKINDYNRQRVYISYTVKPGDTIWKIAEDLIIVNPEFKSTRQYVNAIKNINKIFDGDITAGQNIIIPYYVKDGELTDYDSIYTKYGILHE